MKRFLTKVAIMLLCCLIIAALLLAVTFFWAAPQFQSKYTGAIQDKVQRLCSIDEPKIILVGDSNLAFGIQSPMIEEALELPVVNLGGHGGLGLEFSLNMAKCNIQEGDIVIVSCALLDSRGMRDSELGWISIENYGLWSLVPEVDYSNMARTLPKYVTKTLLHWALGTGNAPGNDCYTRDSFNEYGDNIYPRPESIHTFTKGSESLPILIPDCADALNEFNAYCESQGAVCLISLSPIAKGEFTAPVESFEEYQKSLEDQLDATVISDVTDYFFPYEQFYDTNYHLTDEGAVIRTEQLIADLKNWQSSEQGS